MKILITVAYFEKEDMCWSPAPLLVSNSPATSTRVRGCQKKKTLERRLVNRKHINSTTTKTGHLIFLTLKADYE